LKAIVKSPTSKKSSASKNHPLSTARAIHIHGKRHRETLLTEKIEKLARGTQTSSRVKNLFLPTRLKTMYSKDDILASKRIFRVWLQTFVVSSHTPILSPYCQKITNP
jgi:hypothetical protein